MLKIRQGFRTKLVARPVACDRDAGARPAGGLVEYRVLGPLTVVDQGREFVLGTTREGALLADLLVHANQMVPAGRLIVDLWPHAPPRRAAAAVQTYIKNLRRLLEPGRSAGAPAEVLLSRRPGYLLRVEPGELDAGRFRQLVSEGQAASADGDPGLAAERLSSALALWRGRAFGELGDEAYLLAEAVQLEELRAVALEDRVEADLALGRHGAVAGEMEALVTDHPYRERLW